MKGIMKVVCQTPVVNITKADGSSMAKCTLVLQELGGQYEDSYAATLLGPVALRRFEKETVVAVSLRFQAHEYNGAYYQDIVLQEVWRVG